MPPDPLKGPSPPVSTDSGRSLRSPQKPQTPRSTRSSASATSKPMHSHNEKPPSSTTSRQSPQRKADAPRKRKPTFVSCITFPENMPMPAPAVKEEGEPQRSQRKSKVDALNKLDRAGTPTTVAAGPTATSFVPPPPPPAGPSVTRNPLKRLRVPNPPFDLASVRTRAPPGVDDGDHPGPSHEPRAFDLPTCPTYHPTPEQFRDPMAYVESISLEAKKYGICKIVPPEGWQMPFELETDQFRFTTRLQRLNSIEAASRAKINFLEQLSMYHKQQGDAKAHIPIVDHRLVDLWRLRKEVNKLGGIDEVNRLRAWTKITEMLGFNAASMPQIKSSYTKIILPFENWALRAKSYPESPLTPLPGSANGKPPPGSGVQATPDTPTVAATGGRTAGMRTSPRGRMSALAGGPGGSALAAVMTAADNQPEAGPSNSSDSGLAAPIRIKVPVIPSSQRSTRSSQSSDSELTELSEEESTRTGGSQTSTPEQPTKYEKGDVCEICTLGNNAPKILLCDGCDRGFHTFCLDPPLQAIPTNEWYCTACLLGNGDDYGFDEGEEHSIPSFQARDAAFTKAWFNRYVPTHSPASPLTRKIGNATVNERDVEREFWRLVESQDDTVEVEYGADVHSTTHGSAAPTLETNPLSKYAKDPWNLNNIAIVRDSLLRYIKSDISGMTVPWIYVGMLFSAFCWHNEDHYTYSVNYMFWGETKTWYGIPGDSAEKFEEAIKSEAPELFERQPSLLYQLTTIMNPGRLQEEGVPVYACDQRPNEFVITFPKAYHCGFNHGLNFNEAVNFALPDWLALGRESVERYSLHAKPSVFSHEELLITITLYSDTIKTALWLQDSLRLMVEDESARRKKLRAALPDLVETLSEEDVPEEEYQCYVCKGFCYLAQMTCSCTKLVSCLEHYDLLCLCPTAKRTLRKRYSENQLEDILDIVVARAAQPDQWSKRADAALAVARPQLKTIRQLVADGDRMPHDLPGLEDLRAFLDRANAWVDKATAVCTRKSTGRRRKGRQSEPTATVLDDDDVDRSAVAINALLDEASKLAFDAPEILQLRQMMSSLDGFREQAKAILATSDLDLDYEQCKTALILGQSLNVELPEVADLTKIVARLRWYHKVEEEVDDRTLQYDDIVGLLEQADEYEVPPHHAGVVELRRREKKGREWKEAVDQLLASPKISIDAVSALIEGQEYTPTSVETMRQLENIRKTAQSWQATASSLLQSQGTVGSATRLCKAVRTASGPLKRIDIPEIADLQAEIDFNSKWLAGVAKHLGVQVNKVHTSLTNLVREIEDHLAIDDDYPNGHHACFCRSAPQGHMVTCGTCLGEYHPKCVGITVKSASGIAAAARNFECQMCQHLQYDDRPSFNDLAHYADPVKWDFVLRPSEVDLLDSTLQSVVRYASLVVPIIDPLRPAAKPTLQQIGHLLRKIWTLPVQLDAVNVATKEHVIFEDWLYRKMRDTVDGGPATKSTNTRSRARKPKFTFTKANPHTFSCLCTAEPLDHLLTVVCSKCEQGFHLSCAQAPISVANSTSRGGWRCPFCTVKSGKAPPRGLDLRVQLSDKIGTQEYVDWRKVLFTYSEDPIPVILPDNPACITLEATRFQGPSLPDNFERPVWTEAEETDGRRKRRKTDSVLLPAVGNGSVAGPSGASSSPVVKPMLAPPPAHAAPPPPPHQLLAPLSPAPSHSSTASSSYHPAPNQPAQNVRSNGRLFYPTHSIVPWSNSNMFSQFQLNGNGSGSASGSPPAGAPSAPGAPMHARYPSSASPPSHHAPAPYPGASSSRAQPVTATAYPTAPGAAPYPTHAMATVPAKRAYADAAADSLHPADAYADTLPPPAKRSSHASPSSRSPPQYE